MFKKISPLQSFQNTENNLKKGSQQSEYESHVFTIIEYFIFFIYYNIQKAYIRKSINQPNIEKRLNILYEKMFNVNIYLSEIYLV